MNKRFILFSIFLVLLSLPVLSFADFAPGAVPFANPAPRDSTIEVEVYISIILTILWFLFISFAVIMFLLAGFQFFSAQGEPSGVEKARNSMLWGVVGVVAAIIAFSLPTIIASFFGAG